MKSNLARFANTKVKVETKTAGPRHDPYGRDILTVERWGVSHVLTMCALAGLKYERYEGGKLVYYSEFVYDGEDYDTVMQDFIARTGACPYQWEGWYWRHIYQEDPMGSLGYYE